MDPAFTHCCRCCGCPQLAQHDILWPALIDEWRLARHEVLYINRQQGLACVECGANLRSMALGEAIMRSFGFDGLLAEFVTSEVAAHLRVLEINRAGALTPFLQRMAGHSLREYPEIDMLALDVMDTSFDLVVHSDTLEHVPNPIRALSECRRVLRAGGLCIFTVPMIVDRLTASRVGLPPSYHGNAAERNRDHLVHTEYGCDAWKHIILAGFSECRIVSLEYPAAQAMVAVR